MTIRRIQRRFATSSWDDGLGRTSQKPCMDSIISCRAWLNFHSEACGTVPKLSIDIYIHANNVLPRLTDCILLFACKLRSTRGQRDRGTPRQRVIWQAADRGPRTQSITRRSSPRSSPTGPTGQRHSRPVQHCGVCSLKPRLKTGVRCQLVLAF